MSLGPILPGRLPNSMVYSRSLLNLQSNTRLFQQLQDQVSTGQRFQLMSEDPLAAIQTVILQQTLERKTQVVSNVEVNRSLLSSSEEVLGDIGDVFNQMKSFILAGLGDTTTPGEKQQMALEVDSLIQQVTNLGNTKFRGRYLFGGSQNTTAPFSIAQNNNAIRFNGDFSNIESFVSFDDLLVNNVNAGDTLKPLAEVNGSDLNPALTAQTRLSDLYGGQGIPLGIVSVTVDTGGGPQTAEVDLTNAQTVGDLVTRLEAPFGGDLTVSLNASGLQLTPSAGTVAVSNGPNNKVATRLGIQSAASATINSADLNPRLSKQTTLASLNGGTGIGATAGNGLLISNGTISEVIDLDGLTNIEDLFNAIEGANIDVMTGFSEDGQGLRIASRLSGVNFSIGENGGNNAELLGIRTLTGSTPLTQLDLGKGVPLDGPVDLEMVRRDGTALTLSFDTAKTVQDVLNIINAADPGVLTASLNPVGNGITISDSSGTGPMSIAENAFSLALGIAGEEDGNAPLEGTDVGVSASTDLLAALNDGVGVPVGSGTLDITRRDGSVVNISLAAATSVQDVLDTVNAVDPGNLVLSINPATGSFELNDNSGTGPLSVADNAVSAGLGIAGSEDGVTALTGTDPNPQRAGGVLDLLFRLSTALSNGDNQELEAIDELLDVELEEFNFQRGAVAGRLKSLDNYANTLADQSIMIEESLSNVFDTDMSLAITQYLTLQATIQASQQLAANSMQLNLFNYL